ncbi:MAG: hypothetical protein ACM3KL_03750 [Alphaproteobacteria bacterium]
MKNMVKPIGATIFAAIALCTPLGAQTTTQEASSPSASPKRSLREYPRARLVPYHGMISAVDKNAKTVTIAGKRSTRSFKITDATTITKDGEKISLGDIKQNDEVSGSYLKTSDGTIEARTIKIGPVKRKATPTPSPTPIR